MKTPWSLAEPWVIIGGILVAVSLLIGLLVKLAVKVEQIPPWRRSKRQQLFVGDHARRIEASRAEAGLPWQTAPAPRSSLRGDSLFQEAYWHQKQKDQDA